MDWAAQHPELILSRREVIKYVYTEPGKRAQEVQALLKLDRIDETRRLLRTAMTRSASDEKQATTEVGNAEDALRRHLDLTTLLESRVLGAVNQHRQVLGIAPLDSLQPDTDLIVGAQVAGEHSSFNKASALQDVNELSAFATDHPELDNAALDLAQALAELEDDPGILHALTHREAHRGWAAPGHRGRVPIVRSAMGGRRDAPAAPAGQAVALGGGQDAGASDSACGSAVEGAGATGRGVDSRRPTPCAEGGT